MTQLIADSLSRLLGANALPRYPPFARFARDSFCQEKSMILIIIATYLCRSGHAEKGIYAAISMFVFIEILVELVLISSIIGK